MQLHLNTKFHNIIFWMDGNSLNMKVHNIIFWMDGNSPRIRSRSRLFVAVVCVRNRRGPRAAGGSSSVTASAAPSSALPSAAHICFNRHEFSWNRSP